MDLELSADSNPFSEIPINNLQSPEIDCDQNTDVEKEASPATKSKVVGPFETPVVDNCGDELDDYEFESDDPFSPDKYPNIDHSDFII